MNDNDDSDDNDNDNDDNNNDDIVKKPPLNHKKTRKEKLNEIGIKFLKISKLKQRENVFRLRLIKYVKYYHQKWLNDNIIIEFDPFQTRKWHKRFDLENITNIKLSPLPSKPIKILIKLKK